jgi:circadian clock protein KaiC
LSIVVCTDVPPSGTSTRSRSISPVARTRRTAPAGLEHCPTGIDGLDAITNGGIPRGRTTLMAGGAGCGKTLLATEFLVRGAERGEPGVFLAFEEGVEALTVNVASLGWDLQQL